MTWASHTICGGALAFGFGLNLPLCVLGAILPDLIEKAFHRGRLPHRTLTHNVLVWSVAALLTKNTPIFPLALSALVCHVGLDAFNAFGVPVWKEKKVTLFWGKIRNGTVGEWIATVCVALALYYLPPAVIRYEAIQGKPGLLAWRNADTNAPAVSLDIPDWLRDEAVSPQARRVQSSASALPSASIRFGTPRANKGTGRASALSSATPPTAIAARVVSVHDGDTFTTAEGWKVRLLGIDCPELAQEWGRKARSFTAAAVSNKQVSLDCPKRDRYGRQLCWVFTGDELLQQKLVENGLAVVYMCRKGRYCRLLEEAQKKATQDKAGFWNQGGLQMSPAEFRHRKRQ